jgi:5-formyltetrahydrofolate cyclo-ligase
MSWIIRFLSYILALIFGILFGGILTLGQAEQERLRNQRLNRELKRLKRNQIEEDSGNCIICFSVQFQLRFHPCGHVCVCHACGKKVNNCPLCREPIKQKQRVFIS